MAWIGLFLGLLVGGALGELQGAIVGGFLGWLAGLIWGSEKSKKKAKVETGGDRLARLEVEVAALRERVRRLEGREEGPLVVEEPVHAPEPIPSEPIPSAPIPSEAPPSPPRQPPKPNPIVAWFLGGNTIARVGLVILFVGLAFLIKYASDHAMFPPEARVAMVGMFGIALLGLGGWLRNKRRAYALGMQGAGVATLYLTTFGALRLYGLVPPEAAFFMLAAIAVFAAVLAVTQDAMVLAVLGAGGGFLAPILASTGGGSHVALFSYYLVLNLGILGIAFFKAWRGLNVLGFLFTFFIGVLWGATRYRPELFGSTEPFLAAFFLMYVAVAILYARKQAPDLKHYVDGTVVFGTPLGAFGLQAAMLRDSEFGLAFSALAAAALYMGLAAMLKRRPPERWGLLAEAFLALGVVFGSLAIPFALDARWTSAGWALEGAAIVWLGIRQRRPLARAFGLLLQVGAAVSFMHGATHYAESPTWLDATFLGALILAAAAWVIYRQLARAGEAVGEGERGIAPFAFWWGVAWWLGGWFFELDRHAAPADQLPFLVAVVAISGATLAWLSARRGWTTAAYAARGMLPLLCLVLVGALFDAPAHPMAGWGGVAWTVAVAAQFAVLWLLDGEPEEKRPEWLHVLTPWWLAALIGVELNWLAAATTAHGTAWSVAAAALPAVLLLALTASRAVSAQWPVAAHARSWRIAAAGGLVVALLVWSVYANVSHDGRSDPLPYLPLLNALDLVHALAIAAITLAWRDARQVDGVGFAHPPRRWAALGGGVVFIWLTSALLRTLHHWAGVAYTIDGVENSFLAQASLSVFWSALALALMVYATRSARRILWLVGAGLMGVVVVKLFVIDLSHVGGLARIVSFIVVGVLMLLIGYLSPVPPRKAVDPEETEEVPA